LQIYDRKFTTGWLPSLAADGSMLNFFDVIFLIIEFYDSSFA